MRKIQRTEEKAPPLPKDKPATYENKTVKKAGEPIGNRKSKQQPDDKSGKVNPQKTRERLEYDATKKEQDPGMSNK